MQGRPIGFWGKLRSDGDGRPLAWHPLSDHCADVAACCEALLAQDVFRRRLATLAGLPDLSVPQRARLCVLSALHDAGKFNHGFQRKADPGARDKAGHVGELFGLLSGGSEEAAAVARALGSEEVSAWGADRLLCAALAHHGAPVKLGEGAGASRRTLWQPQGARDPVAGIADLARRAREWFKSCRDRAEPFSEEWSHFQHAFSGLVTLADWIGSDESLFPYAEANDGERVEMARRLARETVARLGLDAELHRRALGALPGFDRLFEGKKPRPAQQSVLDLGVPAGGGLAILEAETGSGKTEAAIARFFALFVRGDVDGMYFALPTRTAATQMHGRVLSAVEAAFPDDDRRPPVILAVPGYVRVDERTASRENPRLAPFRVLWPDDDRDRWRWRGWAAENPKRYLAGAVVVGTIDQVLLSALAVKHAHLRAAALLRHLLVVDEVHASDAYMNRILEVLVERHLAAGGHALLMSATLGAAARERFLRGMKPRALPAVADCEALPYPALSQVAAGARGRSENGHLSAAGQAGRAKTVFVEVWGAAGDAAAIAARALGAGRQGARVVVLRNTVADAVKAQQALEAAAGHADRSLLFSCAGHPAPHHSRFAREDREDLDHALEKRLGPQGPPGGCVVVATQTVQQSLDLDADLMITDLCPMDVLLQRVGRLHRHERTRPAGVADARIVVLVPAERELDGFIGRDGKARGPHGIGTVYEDLRVLEATWRLAAAGSPFQIPAMNRHLVERTTHPEALAGIEREGGERWVAHGIHVRGQLTAKTALAAVNVFDWGKPFGDEGFPQGLADVVKTRLGAGDRLALFEAPFATPFGRTTNALSIPAWLAGDAPDEAAPRILGPVSVGSLRFEFGSRRFVYDRLGLRRETSDNKKHEEEAGDA